MTESGMKPEERDRLVKLETENMYIKERLEAQEKTLTDIDGKLGKLLDAANMGKGAWWATLKIGGVIIVAGGALAQLASWLGYYVGHK